MLGHIQGRGLSVAESSVTPQKVPSASLNCADFASDAVPATNAAVISLANRSTSKLDECPMCGKPPVEPVRVEGVFACRGCTGGCMICGAACIHGDEVCGDCTRAFDINPWVVPA